jgi:O-antigen/teichoic acid export membrane protein
MTLGRFSFQITRNTLREQLSFSAPLTVSQSVNRFSYQTDLMLISAFFPPSAFALYVVGAFELPLVNIIRRACGTVSMPRLTALYHEKRIDEALALLEDCTQDHTHCVPLFYLLFAMAEPFITLLYTEKYLDSVNIFRTYLLLIPLSCANFAVLLQIAGRTRPIMTLSLYYVILSVSLNVGLIYALGLIGPAIGTLLGKIFFSILLANRFSNM